MPIYEYYCPDNHKIYQFYAKTIAQGQRVPRCPDDPRFKMVKLISSFAVVGKVPESAAEAGTEAGAAGGAANDPRMEAAMESMEREFSSIDENDPRAMGRMMRRMAELTGEPIAGEMEAVVRKLEEGADPDSLEEALGGTDADPGGGPGPGAPEAGGPAKRPTRSRSRPPVRDPVLYDYD